MQSFSSYSGSSYDSSFSASNLPMMSEEITREAWIPFVGIRAGEKASGEVEVVSLLQGSPAQRSGLVQKGDIVIDIGLTNVYKRGLETIVKLAGMSITRNEKNNNNTATMSMHRKKVSSSGDHSKEVIRIGLWRKHVQALVHVHLERDPSLFFLVEEAEGENEKGTIRPSSSSSVSHLHQQQQQQRPLQPQQQQQQQNLGTNSLRSSYSSFSFEDEQQHQQRNSKSSSSSASSSMLASSASTATTTTTTTTTPAKVTTTPAIIVGKCRVPNFHQQSENDKENEKLKIYIEQLREKLHNCEKALILKSKEFEASQNATSRLEKQLDDWMEMCQNLEESVRQKDEEIEVWKQKYMEASAKKHQVVVVAPSTAPVVTKSDEVIENGERQQSNNNEMPFISPAPSLSSSFSSSSISRCPNGACEAIIREKERTITFLSDNLTRILKTQHDLIMTRNQATSPSLSPDTYSYCLDTDRETVALPPPGQEYDYRCLNVKIDNEEEEEEEENSGNNNNIQNNNVFFPSSSSSSITPQLTPRFEPIKINKKSPVIITSAAPTATFSL